MVQKERWLIVHVHLHEVKKGIVNNKLDTLRIGSTCNSLKDWPIEPVRHTKQPASTHA